MADEQGKLAAQVVYDTFCRALEKKEWRFDRHDDDLAITTGVQGENMPINILIKMDPERYHFGIYSVLDFEVREEKRMEVALAVNVVNYHMANGCFDYDISTGKIMFRLVQNFYHSQLSADLMDRLLMTVCSVVDEYNQKFLELSAGVLDFETFLEQEM